MSPNENGRPERPPRREAEPYEMDERIPAGIGIVCWVVALIVLLIVHDRLPAAYQWWIWTCVAGVGSGVFGFFYIPYVRRRRGD